MEFILPREYKFYYTPSRDIITTEFHYSSHDILSALIYYNVVTAPLPQANGNYATLGMHYAALGLPRPSVYGSPLAA